MRVDVTDVSKAYGRAEVLRHVSVRIVANRVTALTGPSGSGKSTLLSLIGGAAAPDAGEILLGPGLRPDPALVAWVPQGANALTHRTALDNAAIGALAAGHSLDEAHRRAHDALELVGLSPVAGRVAKQLSGGELQRVSFARALCADRELILADEPTANLDQRNTLRVAELLTRLGRRATVIVATHDPILVEAADEVVDLRSLNAAS